MPDPDSQPPQPRAVSPARWLLMLLPTVIVISMGWFDGRMREEHRRFILTEELRRAKSASEMMEDRQPNAPWSEMSRQMLRMKQENRVMGTILNFVLIAALLLCFALGFLVEKWRRGRIKSVVWAFNYGFMILFGNLAVLVFFFTPNIR